MESLRTADRLVVRQEKEMVEILAGFETSNKYAILDGGGGLLGYAGEEGGSMLVRQFLQSLRPFTIHVVDPGGALLLRLVRPFRWIFHQIDVFDPDGRQLGTIQKRFAVFRRIYSVLDAAGQELYTLFGPVLRPWTFKIQKGDEEIGAIQKKWSGLLKEGFSDADNFGVQFPPELDLPDKALFLGAVFLIDFVHFEKKGSR